MDRKAERLLKGESFNTKAFGNSMTPLLKSGESHQLDPIDWEDVKVGDIVYCKVKGNYYTHLIIAKHPIKGCCIGNAKGKINGWTKSIYGLVSKLNP